MAGRLWAAGRGETQVVYDDDVEGEAEGEAEDEAEGEAEDEAEDEEEVQDEDEDEDENENEGEVPQPSVENEPTSQQILSDIDFQAVMASFAESSSSSQGESKDR